jgi:hypothetical protein
VNESRFDEGRSAAIRSMLIQTVEAEPVRARRVHLRIAIAAVLAALGLTFGGTAVAVALSGGTLFTSEAPVPVATSSTPVAVPSVTPTPTPTPTAPAHPLAITGDRIVPHDIVSAPAASPLWSIDLPPVGNGAPGCTYDTVTDVADGYAILQRRLFANSDTPERCDPSANRLSVTLVDTAEGSIVWNRDWTWDPAQTDSTSARLLGTSGRVLIWDASEGVGPAEVLDLATGETIGAVTVPDGYAVRELMQTSDDSGDVIYTARQLAADGQPTTTWTVRRADPLALGDPRWTHEIVADEVLGNSPIGNSSSVLDVGYLRDGVGWAADVLDADTGAVMAGEASERSYLYFEGFTLRETGFTQYGVPSAVAGIDDAGNEVWSRASDAGISVGRVGLPGDKPASLGLNDGSEITLITEGNQMELIDGPTGEVKWTTDASACAINPASFDRNAPGFILQSDGVLVDPYKGCAFDHETGAPVEVGARRDTRELGYTVAYEFVGGWGTGGQRSEEGVIPASGTATAVDAITGDVLWTRPIASDERWRQAGGYVVGFSNGTMFGVG